MHSAYFMVQDGYDINILTAKGPGKIASLVNKQRKPRSAIMGMPITHLNAI